MKERKECKDKKNPSGQNHMQLRIHPGVHDELHHYRKTPECIKEFGTFGRPPSLYTLASSLLHEALKARIIKTQKP